MAKGSSNVKVIHDLNDIDDDDDEDDDETVEDGSYSYDDFVKMLGEVDDYMHKEREEFKALKELYKNLQVSFKELKTSHNNLKKVVRSLWKLNTPLMCMKSWWSPWMLESLVTYLIVLQVNHILLTHYVVNVMFLS
jgi:hypothetical protein